MQTGQNGVNLIKEFEGLVLTAYYDSVGVLTIGYGHTNNTASASKYPVYPGQTITADQAEQILKEDLVTYENTVNSGLTRGVTQNQFDAMVSFTYNLGGGTFLNSDLLAMLNAGDINGAAGQFELYVHAGGVVLPGLVRRRQAEKALFLNGSTSGGNDVSKAIEAMIKWMKDREGKVTYSMTSRYGPNSYDCSSAVYNALVNGGFLPGGSMGNTETLFNDLEKTGWISLQPTNGYFAVQRGDIFIWGDRGFTLGPAGHTGIFTDSQDTIIHCNYGYNGISTNNHDVIWEYNGRPTVNIYRYSGSGTVNPPTTNPNPGGPGGLIPMSGIFYPDRQLPVSGDTSPSSPALAYYEAGMAIPYDSYIMSNGYAWISYIAVSGLRRYVAVGPDDGRTDTTWGVGFFNTVAGGGISGLVSMSGTFIPDRRLPVSGDTSASSPALDYYEAGMSIPYDSYTIGDGYVWISYIAGSGLRRYVAVGPNDGNAANTWGSGFFDGGSSGGGNQIGGLISMYGNFIPNRRLPVSGDTSPSSPALDYYEAGMSIPYDSYIVANDYVWISYISGSGLRRYVAVGPNDGNAANTWGTGFFN